MTGPLVVACAVLASAAVALLLHAVNGRFRNRRAATVLTSADIGGELGSRATLVQFSSAFCTPCRATRQLLRDVTARAEGVSFVEIDAESHLDLVRRLGILRTPTVLVLDRSGAVVREASGLPRREQVEAALQRV